MGRATITGDPSTGEVCWDLQVANITLPAAAAHIHVGAPGVAGPIIVALTPPDANGVSSGCTTQKDPASGGGTLTGADVQSILTNPAGFYVNVHTSDFPTGAIRGQLTTGLNSAGAFYALPSPLRAYDSRTVTGTGGTTGTTSTTTGTTSTTTGTGTTSTGSKLTTNEVRTIDLSMGRDGTGQMQVAVPAGASAVQITLTITETDATGGFVTAYPSALAQRPATSSINWKTANMDLATTLTIALDARGTIKLSGFGSTHVIVDVLGFYY
jgi:hypothetical protein